MALYINTQLNSLVFNEEEFEINRNYVPDIFMGIGQLDPTKPINIAIDLDKTPVVFVLLFKKFIDEGADNINIYYRESTEELKIALGSYNMLWKSIEEYPDPLPII